MNNIIKSLLTYPDLMQDLDMTCFSTQEQSYITFIKESYENSNEYPTLDLMSMQFPELRFTDPMGNPINTLSEQDSRVYISNFVKQRNNLKQSQLMMQLASQVAQTGLTSDIIDQLEVPHQSKHEDTLSSADVYKQYYDMKKDKPDGIKTGVKCIDDKIGGIPYGTLLTIGGFTSHGKSLWANNIIYHNAINLKYNCVILSLEVPKEQVFNNLLVRYSKEIKWNKEPKFTASQLEKGRLSPEAEDFVFNRLIPDFLDPKEHGAIIIYDESDIADSSTSTMKQLIVEADERCRKLNGYPLDCFLVDHINLCKFDSKSKKSPMEVINDAVSFFHKLALNFRVVDGQVQQLAGIILCQLNREGYKKAEKKKGEYDITALADANEIERSSQVICTVFMNAQLKVDKNAKVQILKNRSGEVMYDPETIHVDPANYIFGDSSDSAFSVGYGDAVESDDMSSLFGDFGGSDGFGGMDFGDLM